MKKHTILNIFLFSFLIASILSCGKDGETGAVGPQGPEGIAGPAGLPGSQIYNGSGVPASSMGATGDYYIDKDNAEMYGPKSSTGWGAPVSLRGEDGADGSAGPEGAPGSKMLSGENAPAVTLGTVGDFYFDKTNATMYGPKTETSWGTGTALRIGQVISYVVTRPSVLAWSSSHQLNISNTVVPIPQDIRDNGIVLAYIMVRGEGTTDVWHPIPGQLWVSTPVVKYFFIAFRVQTNSLWIHAYAENGADLTAGQNPPNADKLRIVMIPADQENSVARIAPVDYSNYEAVKAYYNLPD